MEGEMKVVALFRVSTEAQADSGLGLEAQRNAVELHCEKHQLNLVADFTEAGVSGKTPLGDREQLLKALAYVASQDCAALVVAKLDRLSRDPLTQLTVERALAKTGARVISAAGEGTEGEDPSQVLLRRIMGAVAEAEASVIGARVKAALAAKKARGERLGRPPFGFQLRPGGGGLVPNDDYEKALRCMDLRDQGATYREITEELEQEIGESWTINKVFRIVRKWGDLQTLELAGEHYE